MNHSLLMRIWPKSGRLLPWLNVPGALLFALLQRTPALRVAATAGEFVLASPLGAVLRPAVAAAAALGALHTLAGATQFIVNRNPVTGTVGTPLSPSVAFTVTGAVGVPGAYRISGQLPPGVSVIGASGAVLIGSVGNIAGTPTASGSFSISILAYEFGPSDPPSQTFGPISITFNIAAGAVAPAITTQPAGQTVNTGATVTFSATATGSPAPTFQWLKNGSAIAGAVGATLTLTSVQTSDSATYSVIGSNSAGSVTSSNATLVVNPAPVAPVITAQPASLTATIGQLVTFTAAASGTPAPAFQWRKNGIDLAGATRATLIVNNIQLADAGTYFAVVSNAAGTVSSASATLTVTAPGPAITTQPAGQTAAAGQMVTFTTVASGTPGPTYQWRKDGASIAGATGATLVLSNVQPGDAGAYTVVVTNPGGAVTSDSATLLVNTVAPAITSQPASQTVTAGQAVTFTAAASGAPAPNFQWRKNGVNLAGATSGTLTLGNAQVTDTGTYSVVVTNAAGATASVEASLVVSAATVAPTITTQPASQTAAVGQTVAFTVVVTGAPAPIFQWKKNGADVPGATTATLVIASVQPGDAGDYAVSATNPAGAVTSLTATLTANPEFGRLVNMSVRTSITAAEPFFTVGTVLGGGAGGTKALLVRAVGPSLAAFGLSDAVADCKVDVFAGANIVATNDNWGGDGALAAAFFQVGAFPFAAPTSKDAAVFDPAIPARAYTIQVSGVGGATGEVLAELYDATPSGGFTAATPRLVNVSVLKQIDANASLTVGFVIGGQAPLTVLVRAIGPGLAAFGVTGTMPDPRLALFDSAQAKLTENDNWGGDAQLIAAGAAVGAFPIANSASKDAMLLLTLAPGGYTVQVSGTGGGGATLVEVYEVP